MRSLLALPLLFSIGALACAAPDDDRATSASNLEGVTCSPEATEKYESALASARYRLEGGECDDGTMLWEIAPRIVEATNECPALRAHIATSANAEPLRKTFEDSFIGGIIDGRVRLDAAGDVVFADLPAMLASGVTFYGPGNDGGSWVKMRFAANGELTLMRWVYSDDGSNDRWVDHPGTWRVEQSLVVVEVEGATRRYALLHPWTAYDFGLEFTLTPENENEEHFATFPIECGS